MRLLEWFRAKQILDPEFGRMTFEKRLSCWATKSPIALDAERPFLFLSGDQTGPSEQCRRAFQQLAEQFEALRPDIAKAVHTLTQDAAELDGLNLVRSERVELLNEVQLSCVHVDCPTSIQLTYGFAHHVGWDDAILRIAVVDWRVMALSLDD